MKSTEICGNSLVTFLATISLMGCASHSVSVSAQTLDESYFALTYADLADLSDAATLVVKVQIRKQAVLEPERSPGLRHGWVRLYIEAETEALLSGQSAIGESLSYLVDVPLDAKGKPPKLKKQRVLLFAHAVPGRPSQLQLVTTDAQLLADEMTELRVRALLAELAPPDAPARITGVRDAMSVTGNLAGESETQLFLETENGAPVSLTIIRRPGMAPEWGVSWTEIVDQAARPPLRDTLAWYRLACFLPDSLPYDAILSRDGASRVRAAQDYRLVMQQLGSCSRDR